jgi:hypothetical protein
MMAKNSSTPMGYRRLKVSGAQRHFFLTRQCRNSRYASAEIRATLVVALWRLATDATQAAGGDETVLKLRSVTERKQSKMGGDDETDV